MQPLQQLAFEALRDKRLPFRAKPFAESMSRLDAGMSRTTSERVIRMFLDRVAEWKTPTGKRVKSELKAMLSNSALALFGFLLVAENEGPGTAPITVIQSYQTIAQCERNGERLKEAFRSVIYTCIEDNEG